MRASGKRLALAVLTIGTIGCAELGFRNRTLWRLPSPDGTLIAVCQEIPEFDGPSHDIRVEQPDGTMVKKLYRIGDGDPCSEMAWAPDGRTLAILSGHVARVRIVDVAWALQQKDDTRYWSWPQIDLGSERLHRNAGALRFTGPREIELKVCGPQPYRPGDSGRRTCPPNSETRRIAVPDRR